MEQDLRAVEFCYLLAQLNCLLFELISFLLLLERGGLFYGVGFCFIGEVVALDSLYLLTDAYDPLFLLGLDRLRFTRDIILSLILEIRQEVTTIDTTLLFFILLRGSLHPSPVDTWQFEAKLLPVRLDASPHDSYPLGQLVVIHFHLDRLLLILT